jgi:ribosomal protein S18 acetylase RimI-like enzyme
VPVHRVRLARDDDADALRGLVASEGWNAGLHDVATFARAGELLVAEIADRPVGMILATPWNETLGWIGWYLVAAEHRGRGIGLDLFGHALEVLAPGAVGLDGDPAQVANYRRSGFVAVHGNVRFRGAAGSWSSPAEDPVGGLRLVPAAAVDAATLPALDAATLPVPRVEVIRTWLDQPEAIAIAIVAADGAPAGWALGRPARIGWKIGPVLAPGSRVADALIAEVAAGVAAAAGPATALFLDVPATNAEALDLVRGRGFAETPTSGRMLRAGRSTPVFPEPGPFAILGHEVG